MSTTLDYTTIEPVPAPIAAQIEAVAQALLHARDWWAEPLYVSQDEKSRKLVGSTRLFLRDYSLPGHRYVIVPEDEEYLLICADIKCIVAHLSEWSAEFNLSWRLEMDGNVVGEINGGKPSAQLMQLVAGICSMSKVSPDRIPELLKKHRARKD
jgi:hypothetical protein